MKDSFEHMRGEIPKILKRGVKKIYSIFFKISDARATYCVIAFLLYPSYRCCY